MDRLQTKVAECKYRDPDRLLREQFIGRLNNDGMTNDTLKDSTALENNKEAMSECMLGRVHRVEEQEAI